MKLHHSLTRTIVSVCVCLSLSTSNAFADPLLDQAEKLAKLDGHVSLEAGMEGPEIKKALSDFNALHWTQILPVNDLIMFESQDGELMMLDTTARIAIRGDFEVYDLWNKRPIKTEADARDSWLVKLSTFDIKDGDLPLFRYGLDKKEPDLSILIDPKGEFNKKLFDQMRALADKYSFELILTPLMGEASVKESVKLWCAKDREESLDYLMKEKPANLALFSTCDKDPLMRSTALASLLHIKGLPHIVRKDGLQMAGIPDDITEFMKRTTSNLGKVNINESK